MSRERTQRAQREEIEDVIGRWAWLLVLLGVGILCFACLFIAPGCTVRPKVVRNQQASFDGNEQNSGLIGHDSAGNGIITAHARERYNAMIDAYGPLFKPPVRQDDGVRQTATNTFLIDGEHLFIFATMNRWRHQNFTPESGK